MRKNELKKHDGACAKQAGVNARLRCIPVDVLDASNIPQRDEVILACARTLALGFHETQDVLGETQAILNSRHGHVTLPPGDHSFTEMPPTPSEAFAGTSSSCKNCRKIS